MKHIFLLSWDMAMRLVGWARGEAKESAENFLRDFRSLRALWNYIFLALYTWVIVWGVLFHAETCINTAIVTTGGIVSWIFSNYVVSSHMDKRLSGVVPGMNGNGNGVNGAQDPPTAPAPMSTTPQNDNG